MKKMKMLKLTVVFLMSCSVASASWSFSRPKDTLLTVDGQYHITDEFISAMAGEQLAQIQGAPIPEDRKNEIILNVAKEVLYNATPQEQVAILRKTEIFMKELDDKMLADKLTLKDVVVLINQLVQALIYKLMENNLITIEIKPSKPNP